MIWVLLFLIISPPSLSFSSEPVTEPNLMPKVKRLWVETIHNGLFYLPNDNKSHPGVVLLHGSEGGSARSLVFMATELAHQGYAVMTYCYFNCWKKPGEPSDTLAEIELNKILKDIEKFKNSDHVNGSFAIYGHSRGAELALILASSLNSKISPDAVIAHAPSDTYVGIYNSDWKNQKCWIPKSESANTQTNSKDDLKWNPQCGGKNPNEVFKGPDWTKKSAWNINGANISQGTRIKIENYKNPIMITHGTNDKVWSVERTRKIEKSLKDAELSPEIYYFENAGHSFTEEHELKRKNLIFDFLNRNLKTPVNSNKK